MTKEKIFYKNEHGKFDCPHANHKTHPCSSFRPSAKFYNFQNHVKTAHNIDAINGSVKVTHHEDYNKHKCKRAFLTNKFQIQWHNSGYGSYAVIDMKLSKKELTKSNKDVPAWIQNISPNSKYWDSIKEKNDTGDQTRQQMDFINLSKYYYFKLFIFTDVLMLILIF